MWFKKWTTSPKIKGHRGHIRAPQTKTYNIPYFNAKPCFIILDHITYDGN
jgi:hypothetical protein